MRWSMTVLVVVAACRGGGDGGDAVVPVDDTSQVDVGGDDSGLVWVDAEGQVVPVVSIGGRLYYADPSGLFWSISAGSSALAGDPADVVFTDPGCTEAWSWAYTPRVVVEDGSGEATRFFVPPDDAATTTVDGGFRMDEALGCVPGSAIGDYFSLTEVVPQAVWWTPPLHPEYR